MRDLLLLLIVGLMFAFGYFLMDRLDRFLNTLQTACHADETENSDSAEVENPCFQCYNTGCKNRVRYPVGRFAGQEVQEWKQPDKIRTGFLGRLGMTAERRGS